MERFSQNNDVAVFISTDAGGTGLNLQSASVLINMDVPWNPAILEQRNARIHRLGQNQKVQIILMVASNSYEEKVLALLKNKQTLFDNVVASDANEDVVGVTRKTLDTLVQELQNKDPIEAPANEVAEQTISDTTDDPAETSQLMPDDEEQTLGAVLVDVNDEDDHRIKQVISQLSYRFYGRIEQILGKEGDLLVILDQLNNEDSAFIDSLDSPISVAVIDIANLRQLKKLGGLSPLSLLRELPVTAGAQVRLDPWLKQARDKLVSAKLLHQHAQTGSLDLLVAAVCAKLTSLAEKKHLLSAEEACVCVYTELKLQQKLNAEQVASIGRLLSLRANAALPAYLLLQLLNDVEVLLENDE
jgi:hypothetical protein